MNIYDYKASRYYILIHLNQFTIHHLFICYQFTDTPPHILNRDTRKNGSRFFNFVNGNHAKLFRVFIDMKNLEIDRNFTILGRQKFTLTWCKNREKSD